MVHVLGFIVFHPTLGPGSHPANLLESFENADEFVGRQKSGSFQRAGMGPTGRQFVAQQPAVEVKRPLPAFELRVQRLLEPARPHLHRATSTRARARVREGSPRIRMKPSASFWS